MELQKMAEEEKKEEKKIIIDEDWKQQAQKEKKILAAQEKDEKKEPGKNKAERGPLPKGNFAALLSMLTTQALFAMGVLKIEGQEREPDLEMARYNIDMLETLQEKTKGNLTEEEKKVLDDTLNQIRMAYVKIAG
jgi:DNA replication initiation complex subunit (GINS family)